MACKASVVVISTIILCYSVAKCIFSPYSHIALGSNRCYYSPIEDTPVSSICSQLARVLIRGPPGNDLIATEHTVIQKET